MDDLIRIDTRAANRDTSAMSIDEAGLYHHVGNQLRKRRQELGLTQGQLADQIRVLRTSVTNIEAGRQKAPLHVLYALCAELEIELADILPRSSDIAAAQPARVVVPGHDEAMPPQAAAFLQELIGDQESGPRRPDETAS